MPRFRNLLISVSIMLVAVGVALYQVNTLLQQLSPPSPARGPFDPASALRRRELAHWHGANQLYPIDVLTQQVQGLVKEALIYRQEMEEVKGRVLQLERELRGINKPHYTESMMRASPPDEEREREHHPNLNAVQFSPLKDKLVSGDFHVHHYFISALKGRGSVQGPPELFLFPRVPNDTRILCLRGNSTSDGSKNAYAFVESVPTGAYIVPGVTLLSDTAYDFNNLWHSMFNLLQFVYWRVDSRCSRADNLLLFHLGEFRITMGGWIKSILQACGLPTAVSYERVGSHDAVCFEQAIVSRSGIGGVQRPLLSRIFKEVRCQARRACHVQSVRRSGRNYDGRVNVTLMVREGTRGFVDEGAWRRVIKEQCEATLDCRWNVMYVANLTFCQQVEFMTHTDILLSAHGAQLANIIFMEPGGSIMEMFPFGWLKMAGHGQFIYRNLATWLDLQHEGYWRDTFTRPCPNVTDSIRCFSYYKDQPIGINVTYIGPWLNNVIKKFKESSLNILNSSKNHDKGNCECDSK